MTIRHSKMSAGQAARFAEIDRLKAVCAVLDTLCEDRFNEIEQLRAVNAELVAALELIASETSGAIQRARNRNDSGNTLLDVHATVIDVQIKARDAIEKARAALAKAKEGTS